MVPRIKTVLTKGYVEVTFIVVDKTCYFKFGNATGCIPVSDSTKITIEQLLEGVVERFMERNKID